MREWVRRLTLARVKRGRVVILRVPVEAWRELGEPREVRVRLDGGRLIVEPGDGGDGEG